MSWLPSPEYADWWYNFSWKGIICFGGIAAFATAATVMFTVIQFWSDGIRDEIAEKRSLSMEIALAESKAREKEAELKIEQLRIQLGPRKLDEEAFRKELAGKPIGIVEVMYQEDDPDSRALAMNLTMALDVANWRVMPPWVVPLKDPGVALTPKATRDLLPLPGWTVGVTIVTGDASDLKAMQQSIAGPLENPPPFVSLSHALLKGIGRALNSTLLEKEELPDGKLRIVIARRL